jgi:hypothetical protein
MLFYKKPTILIFLITLISLSAALFTLTVNASPAKSSASVQRNILADSNVGVNGKYTFSRCNSIRKKPFNNKSPKRKILLIGDSHGCDFLNAMLENNYLQNYQISMRYIPYQCQPVLHGKGGKFVAAKDRALCANEARTDSLSQAKEQMSEANIIIFAARWKLSTARVLPFTIKHLRLKAHQKIIVIGSKNFGKITARRYMGMARDELLKLKNNVDPEVQKINAILRHRIKGRMVFVDQTKLLCGSSEKCPVFTDHLRLFSYDGWHFTKSGARYAGKVLYQKSILGRM